MITTDTLDVLCHAAVRARNCSVLLASCCQPDALSGLRSLAGSHVNLSISQARPHCLQQTQTPSTIRLISSPEMVRRPQVSKLHAEHMLSPHLLSAGWV